MRWGVAVFTFAMACTVSWWALGSEDRGLPVEGAIAVVQDAGALGEVGELAPPDRIDERQSAALPEPAPEPAEMGRPPDITGVVYDAFGDTVRGAKVLFAEPERSVRTALSKEAGRFAMWMEEGAVRGDLLVRSGKSGTGALISVAPGDHVEVRLTEARYVALDVGDGIGAPVERYEVACEVLLSGRWIEDEFGRGYAQSPYRICCSAVPLRFSVESEGYDPFLSASIEPEEIGDLVPVRLKRRAHIEGVVLRDGQPVNGARLELLRADRSSIGSEPWINLSTLGKEHESTGGHYSTILLDLSNRDGQFSIEVDEPGQYEVRAWGVGRGGGSAGPFSIEPYVGVSGVEVSLEIEPANVSGVVLIPEGAGTEQLRLYVPSWGASARVNPDRTFLMEGLPPGLVVVYPRFSDMTDEEEQALHEMIGGPFVRGAKTRTEYPAASLPPWMSVDRSFLLEVAPGSSVEATFDLRGEPPYLLDGRVELGQRPVQSGWFSLGGIYLDRMDGTGYESLSEVKGGAFALGTSKAGAYRLRMDTYLRQGVSMDLVADVRLSAPVTQWSFAPPIGSLRIACDNSVELVWEGADNLRLTLRSKEREEGGSWFFPEVPAGEVILVGEGGVEFDRVLAVAGETRTYEY